MIRYLRYTLESILLLTGLLIFRILPIDIGSAIGGMLGRAFGPFSKAHLVATKNIELAMPELSQHQRDKIIMDMWDNLGRVMCEYPHLSRPMMWDRITIEGREHVDKVKNAGTAAIFISGHFANWEIAPLTAYLCGMPLVLIYRAANNPVADWIIRYIRSKYNLEMYGKGREGAQQAIKALKAGNPIGMLIDQKMNDGKAMMFFGRKAMTATAATHMAIKMQVPLIMAHVVRTDGAHFHVTLQPPVMYDKNRDPINAMEDLNALFEKWIRENPSQWFWVHRRWGK
jgi:KDO2-lipid IV(A) lauroyltransferase